MCVLNMLNMHVVVVEPSDFVLSHHLIELQGIK